jgi:hypothetical protein
MNKQKGSTLLLAVILFALLLAGGGTYFYMNNKTGGLSDSKPVITDNASTTRQNLVKQEIQGSGDIFCQTKFPSFKYSEYETVYSGEFAGKEQITKQWEKDDSVFLNIYGKTTMTNSNDVFEFWEVRNKKTGEVVNYNCDNIDHLGGSNCSRTVQSLTVPYDNIIVYNNELGTEKRIIGGQECVMLKTPRQYSFAVGKNINQGQVDCINKTSCEFLIDSANEQSDATTKIIKIDYSSFLEGIFTPPTNYSINNLN